MGYSEQFLKDAHVHAKHHRKDVEAGPCGCFYCLSTFDGLAVAEWIDRAGEKATTALCPRCGIDAVLPAARSLPIDDPEFLEGMHRVWFETTYKPRGATV